MFSQIGGLSGTVFKAADFFWSIFSEISFFAFMMKKFFVVQTKDKSQNQKGERTEPDVTSKTNLSNNDLLTRSKKGTYE